MNVAQRRRAHRGGARAGAGRSLRARRHAAQRLHGRDLSRQRRDPRASASPTSACATTWWGRARACSSAGGRVLMPGYIDPHVHPAHLITPSALRPPPPAARAPPPSSPTRCRSGSWAASRAFRVVADALARSPLKFYWMIRVHAQSRTTDEAPALRARATRAGPRPSRGRSPPARSRAGPTCTAGAATCWSAWPWRQRAGQRVEGHTAGAAAERDRRPRRGRPHLRPRAHHRARGAGPRASGDRGDAARVVAAPRPARAARRPQGRRRRWPRGLMLTADGSMPAFIRDHGFVDHLIRVALERGVPPVDAYRMATLNPATYFGREPRSRRRSPPAATPISACCADLGEPRPETVVARGRVAARTGGRSRACPSRTGRAPSRPRPPASPCAGGPGGATSPAVPRALPGDASW